MNPILILARLILPLLILKYPLIGGAIAIYLDNLDWHTKDIFNLQPFGDYQSVDKLLDLYYLSLLALVARSFKDILMRNIILGLFFYRAIGVFLFELTDNRWLLFVFPNIFENLFFFYYIVIKTASYTPKISPPVLGLMLIIVTLPKMLHEYSVHIIQQPITIQIAGLTLHYDGLWSQIIFLVTLAVRLGLFYRSVASSTHLR